MQHSLVGTQTRVNPAAATTAPGAEECTKPLQRLLAWTGTLGGMLLPEGTHEGPSGESPQQT